MDSTKRFTDKVENYIKYRPGYPKEIIQYIKEISNLKIDDIIADIGSGTGILTKMFLEEGNTVIGIEPNDAMRSAGENELKDFKNFISVKGTAENTTLQNKSVDLITCAQSFHWFDVNKTRSEFKRILNDNGLIALIWNKWDGQKMGFSSEYEGLLIKYGTDYNKVRRQQIPNNKLNEFFDVDFKTAKFYNNQILDMQGLTGRLLSASYSPKPGDGNFEPMITELKKIFEKYNQNGILKFEYETVIYSGRLT